MKQLENKQTLTFYLWEKIKVTQVWKWKNEWLLYDCFLFFIHMGQLQKSSCLVSNFLLFFVRTHAEKKTCWYRYVAIFRTLCLIPTKIVENKKRLKVTIMRMKNWIVLFLTWNCLREIQKIKSRNRYKRFCKRFKWFWKCNSAKDKVINAYKTVS